MAYGGIMFYNLHMPLYILGTFTEYPLLRSPLTGINALGILDNGIVLYVSLNRKL